MAWSSCLQKGNPVGTAVGDSDGEQLAHCDVGFMLRAQVGNALEVDVGAVLGALVGNVLGPETRTDPSSVLHLASKMAGSEASHWLGDTLGALVGDADGYQLGTALGIQDGG